MSLPKHLPKQPKPIKPQHQQPDDALAWSIDTVALKTSECRYTVKTKARLGIYRAWKSGRRTLIDPQSVKDHIASLPVATFLPMPTRRASKRA